MPSTRFRSSNRSFLASALLACAALGCVLLGARAQGAGQAKAGNDNRPDVVFLPPDPQAPKFVPGEAVVRLASGADAQAIAQRYGIQVKSKLRFAPETYVLSGIQADLNQAIEALRQTPGVVSASRNVIFRFNELPQVTPTDPLLDEQWALRVMNAPQLWGVTVGERLVKGPKENVLVAVLDGTFKLDHPDLQENFAPGAWDFVRDQPYDQSTVLGLNTFLTHGTNVAGCLAAVTNNGEGISSLPWEGVQMLACHVGDFFGPNLEDIIDAIYYSIDQGADVINMSFGAFQGSLFDDELLHQAVRDAYGNGIVMTAAAGNGRIGGFSFGVEVPAAWDEVIAVGAVGPFGELAEYSDTGPELDIVAPGGNSGFANDFTRALLTTDASFFTTDGYILTEGTSFASPYVAGAIATLITQGAVDETVTGSARVEALRNLILSTARNPFGQHTDEYGNGILDVNAALRRFTQVIEVISPTLNEVSASFSEPVEARIIQPVPTPLQEGDFFVEQNGEDITDLVEILDPNSGSFLYEPSVDTRYAIGSNTIDIIAENALIPDAERSLSGPASGRIPERAFRFRVLPRTEQPGLKMISIPYELQEGTDTLPFLFGGNLVRLARWLPEQNRYAIFDVVGSPQDPEADLTTDSAGVRQAPLGVGYWARILSPTQIQLFGTRERSGSYEIPLKPGFNQVGNPYPFRVPFTVLNVRFGQEVMSVQEAVNRELISNAIWRYIDGRYSFQVLPAGELVDWESHWIRAFDNISLIVPRVPSVINTGSGASAQAVPAGSGWKSAVRLVADGRTAATVLVGQSGAGRDGFGPEDVETPPSIPGAPDLKIRHRDWGRRSGAYAQDVRSERGRTQRWTLAVETSKAGVPVKLAWDGFPRGVHGYLQVNGGSRPVSLDKRGTLQFTPSRAGVHELTLVATRGHGA